MMTVMLYIHTMYVHYVVLIRLSNQKHIIHHVFIYFLQTPPFLMNMCYVKLFHMTKMYFVYTREHLNSAHFAPDARHIAVLVSFQIKFAKNQIYLVSSATCLLVCATFVCSFF